MDQKYFFFDFDGICSKYYANTIEGKFFKTINAGSKEAIKILHQYNYKAICITADSSNVGQKIIKDWCEHVKADDLIFCKVDEKLHKIANYIEYGSIVAYVGDDIYDDILFRTVDRGYIPESSAYIFRNDSHIEKLFSDKPLLEAVLKETLYEQDYDQETLFSIFKIRGLAIKDMLQTPYYSSNNVYLLNNITKQDGILLLWIEENFNQIDLEKALYAIPDRKKAKFFIPKPVYETYKQLFSNFVKTHIFIKLYLYEPKKTCF